MQTEKFNPNFLRIVVHICDYMMERIFLIKIDEYNFVRLRVTQKTFDLTYLFLPSGVKFLSHEMKFTLSGIFQRGHL